MRNKTRTLAAITTLLTPLSALAAGPFSVLRATSPDAAATATPVAVVAVSPFEDGSTLLHDGQNYFYLVRDASGAPVRLSVTANPMLGGVRVAFDDGDPASAPTAAPGSSVALTPASIPADGVSVATATIVPRDANGVVLGTGLAVTIEAAAVWPGTLRGGILDLGDGTYMATIVSSIPGSGSVRVRVEGVTLATEPSISFVNTGNSGSLREQARDLLAGLGAADGPLASLEASGGAAASSYSLALAEIREAVAGLSPGNPVRDKQDAMHQLDEALESLLAAAATDPRAALLVDDVLEAARLLALYHTAAAESLCGACNGTSPKKVCASEAGLDRGDALRVSSPATAMDAYTRSVDAGIQARTTCN